MATRDHVKVKTPHDGNAWVYEWSGLLQGDDGDWLPLPVHADKCVQAYGTWGVGAAIVLEGTNEEGDAPANPDVLHDPSGVNLTLSNAEGSRLKQALESPYKIRPRVSGGDGTTALTVRMIVIRG